MTKRQQLELVISRVQHWQRMLGLMNWRLAVKPTKKKKYSIQRDFCYQRAIISVGEIGDEPMDEFVCHELLHLVVGEITHLLKLIDNRLTHQEKELFHEAEERTIEVLIRAIHRIMKEVRECG